MLGPVIQGEVLRFFNLSFHHIQTRLSSMYSLFKFVFYSSASRQALSFSILDAWLLLHPRASRTDLLGLQIWVHHNLQHHCWTLTSDQSLINIPGYSQPASSFYLKITSLG